MEIITLSKDLYDKWNQFCAQSNDAWFWHTTEYFEFMLNLNSALHSASLSFFVKEKDEIIAVVPLFLEIVGDVKEFSFGANALPMPVLKNNLDEVNKHRILQYIFSHIDILSKKYNVSKVAYKSSPLAPGYIETKYPQSNILMRYSFIDTSSATRIIDLQKSKEELWNELRRNFTRIITKDDFDIIIYDKERITQEIFDEYRLMHAKAAGRVTRPLITYEKEYLWIKKGIVILVGSKDKTGDKHIGFEDYIIYKNNVHGFTAANDPDYHNFPIRHRIEWEAMMWLKEHGCRYYEIGNEYYGSHLHYFPSKKEITISRFKQGYGGFAVPLFMGEKYYSSEYFKRMMRERIEKYINQYNWEIKIKPIDDDKNEDMMQQCNYSQMELEEALNKVITDKVIQDYLNGKVTVVNYIIGQVKRQLGVNYIDHKNVINMFKRRCSSTGRVTAL